MIITALKQTSPATIPITNAPAGPTKPTLSLHYQQILHWPYITNKYYTVLTLPTKDSVVFVGNVRTV
jgi:hypothetical protein